MTTRKLTLPLLLLLACALASACEDQTVDIAGSDAAVADGAGEEDATPDQGSLTVAVDGAEQVVALGDLAATSDPAGLPAVVLADALLAAGPTADLDAYLCDFVASDGFRTSSRGEGCEPISCARTVDAFVALGTNDATWRPELGMRGCYGPTGLARVEMTPVAADAQ